MPEAYTHIRIARAALAQSGEHAPSTAAYEMGANGPDPLFAYRVLSAKRPWPLPELGGRMHDEQCGRFLRTMIFAASTPAQRSYALGFLAHYAADSVMHPYVAFQCGPQGQFNIPEGHGFCEVAMDSMFHEQDCGSSIAYSVFFSKPRLRKGAKKRAAAKDMPFAAARLQSNFISRAGRAFTPRPGPVH